MFAVVAAFVLTSGNLSEINAQRDPFKKAGWATPRSAPTGTTSGRPATGSPAAAVKPVVNYGPPEIEARIEHFKRLRETAAATGAPIPKVTSVLTLSEMSVTGIFKTPRGYAAMVEATPIKLSYTIYPGEKFFDGQLVAVEENRLVFRKVSKVGEGKFVASVEHMPLKQYSMKAQVEGTAPPQSSDRPTQIAAGSEPPPVTIPAVKPNSNPFLSPLDEMNNQPVQPAGSDKAKPVKGGKRPAKIARN